jgi:hypothetical protein
MKEIDHQNQRAGGASETTTGGSRSETIPAGNAPESAGPASFDQWALVELFGHQQIVGRVTECTQFGGAFLRVDVPEVKGVGAGYTRFYHPNAIYSLNPVDEQTARAMLTQSRFRNEPVKRYEVPMLSAGTDAPNPNADYCPNCQELEENCTCQR